MHHGHGSQAHWQQVYQTKAPDSVSWYQPTAARSLALLCQGGLGPQSAVIDVGGGTSCLVDALLDASVGSITVLDLAEAALALTRQRLGERASQVTWLVGDITQVALPAQAYDLWHDRAVFHFMTTPEQRTAYLLALQHALKPGGHVVMSTFADDGPERCSGLPVQRYSREDLLKALGPRFSLLAHEHELHTTPGGMPQAFNHALLRFA
ncbi:class I SAM-dependent methyltransferase [Aquabacterium sp. A3]|uniref:class I SAM-dependent methyltransferase n=1 Tax=Aquabacterium sp. A3 TaxID=3132829 RepID=UPI00311A0DF7